MFNIDTSGQSSDESSNDQSDDGDDGGFAEEYAPNETADLYLSFGDWKRTISQIIEATDGLEVPTFSPGSHSLEEADDLMAAVNDHHPMVALWAVSAVGKADLGERQANENSHGIGLDTSEGVAPRKGYYADVFRSLPTIETAGLEAGEKQEFHDNGVDPEALGFNPKAQGPMLPVVDGERVPIAVDSIEDVLDALDLLSGLPSEPSTFDADEDTSEVNPSNHTVSELRDVLQNVDSVDTLNDILEAEESGKDRTTAKEAIESRISSVEGSTESDDSEVELDDDSDAAEYAAFLIEEKDVPATEAIQRAGNVA